MPTHLISPLRAALIAVFIAALFIPASAGATRPADLRIVNPDGETLAQHIQYTGGVKIKTDPGADCFGEGTGGSGDKVTVPGATALGAVEDATNYDKPNRFGGVDPLSVTDFFDFGLGVCGIGGAEAPSTGYWYLKVNHVGSQVGGDQARLETDDEVLWYLIDNFKTPIPRELELTAPDRVKSDAVNQTVVRVWEYDDDGSRRPAIGADVDGASKPTDKDGETRLDQLEVGVNSQTGVGGASIQASRKGSIPSEIDRICVASDLLDCQSQPPVEIFGSDRRDVIRGTRGNDRIFGGEGKDIIRAKRGDDLINVRGGGRDRVRCGAGNDTVRAGKRDKLKGCE